MTSREVDALLDLVLEKNRIIAALEQALVEHGIPLPDPVLVPEGTP